LNGKRADLSEKFKTVKKSGNKLARDGK